MSGKPLWVQTPPRGWILYDADCGFCSRWAWRIALFAGPAGFHLAPLQAPWVRQRLQLSDARLMDEMRVLTAAGDVYGGADALLHVARRIWWSRPFTVLAWIPGVMPLSRAAYRWIARHRHEIPGACPLPSPRGRRVAVPMRAAATALPHRSPGQNVR